MKLALRNWLFKIALPSFFPIGLRIFVILSNNVGSENRTFLSVWEEVLTYRADVILMGIAFAISNISHDKTKYPELSEKYQRRFYDMSYTFGIALLACLLMDYFEAMDYLDSET